MYAHSDRWDVSRSEVQARSIPSRKHLFEGPGNDFVIVSSLYPSSDLRKVKQGARITRDILYLLCELHGVPIERCLVSPHVSLH